jgi:hypothetical protein
MALAIEPQTKYNREQLLYRAQFVLGPRPINDFPSGKQTRINDRLWLSTQADLKVTQAVAADKSLTLLGYILDPDNPRAGDSEIVAELLPKLCSGYLRTNSPQCTNRLGGRWILIADDGAQIRIFNDTIAQRQICYTAPPLRGEVWCASQPGVLARVLDLKVDPAAEAYLQNVMRAGEKEYWWPYDTSLYREIRFLNANHFLDYRSAKPHRFWPVEKLATMPIRRAVKEGALLIRGLMASAANRHPLQILMTGGWDSRLVLSATKGLNCQMTFLTFLREGFTMETPDVSIPRRLLQKLGRTHEILPLPQRMDDEFREIYMQNTAAAHEEWGRVAQALYSVGPPEKLRVTGVGAEVIRQQFRPAASTINPEVLAHFASANGQEFAIQAFKRWLADTPINLPVGIPDLLFWEQKIGIWLANGQTEWDIIGSSSFTPYNCRSLLATLLSVNEEYRKPPFYELHRALIKEMWPETLSEPVNPHKKMHRDRVSIKSVTKRFLVRTHLLDYIPDGSIHFAKKVVP